MASVKQIFIGMKEETDFYKALTTEMLTVLPTANCTPGCCHWKRFAAWSSHPTQNAGKTDSPFSLLQQKFNQVGPKMVLEGENVGKVVG